jgi:hypothetical protein
MMVSITAISSQVPSWSHTHRHVTSIPNTKTNNKAFYHSTWYPSHSKKG